MYVVPRVLAVSLLTAALAAVPVAAHAAATYPPSGGNSITVDSTAPVVGGSFTVVAKTYKAGSDVDITTRVVGPSATVASAALIGGGRGATVVRVAASGACVSNSTCTVVAPASGVVTASVRLTVVGDTEITVSGVAADGTPLTQTIAVSVKAAPAAGAAPGGSGSDLARTGAAGIVQTAGAAILMLAVGTGLVMLVRRRRDGVAAA